MYPKISIVTPNYNLGSYLERTIQSVVSQNYPNLEYIIIDGGSIDNSIEIINQYLTKITYFISEKDNGLYHALNKGFSKSTGEILGWINSDDILQPNSLFKIAEYFNYHSQIQWLQGKPSVIDENDQFIFEREGVSDKNFFYMKEYLNDGKFIQQESTFWKRELWEKCGSYLSEDYGLAGDFDLWMRFFKYEDLYCVKEKLGSFRKRKGQLSANEIKYITEANEIINLQKKTLSFLENMKLKFWQIERKLLSLIKKSRKYQNYKIDLN